MRFFKKTQERILKTKDGYWFKQIDPRSLGSWYIKGTEESTLGKDS